MHRTLASAVCLALLTWASAAERQQSALLNPDDPAVNLRAPDDCRITLETNKGRMVLQMRREWAPHGADRFYSLVHAGYYDGARFFRIRAATWAQFGVSGNPAIAKAWRNKTIPDDPFRESNVRGTVAYAFKDPNGRTTQAFINLRDNSTTHDREPFVPFAKVIEGMEVADSLYAEYGERAGGGIRAGHQDPLFDGGNGWLLKEFPKLDYIVTAKVDGQKRSAAPEPTVRLEARRVTRSRPVAAAGSSP